MVLATNMIPSYSVLADCYSTRKVIFKKSETMYIPLISKLNSLLRTQVDINILDNMFA